MRLNNLTTSVLQIGQRLKLPTNSTENQDYEIYIVKSGDSLWNIAKKYNVSLSELLNFNNLNSNTLLQIGQTLKIPKKQTNVSETTYIVQKGDSLWNIAQKYNTTVDAIMKENNLKSNLLSIGQVLKIPNTTSSFRYTVQKGDSLWSIAQKYNTTVDAIKKKNNLSSNNLSIGQQLII